VGLGPNQVCTLFGASPGSAVVPGKDYVKAGYSLNTADLWRRNYLVLVAFFLFFCFTQTAVIEIFPQLVGGGGAIFYTKDTPETKKLNADLKVRKVQKAEEERQEKIRVLDGVKTKRESYVLRSSNCSVFTRPPTGIHSLTGNPSLGRE
jgi:ATP-binding cassette subfamily G (WHITE) protein 2 (SNQ2)